MATKEELERENEVLREENDGLREENEQLREQLDATRAGQPATRPKPEAPSFGMSEGVRADLEQVEKTTDPFTGKTVTREDVK